MLTTAQFCEAFDVVDPWLSLQVIESNIPLLTLAATSAEGTFFSKSYCADGRTDEMLRGNAPLHGVGSLSKALAVAGLCKLVEQGRASLTDNFLDYFPELKVPKDSTLRRNSLLDLARHQTILQTLHEHRQIRFREFSQRQHIPPDGDQLIRILGNSRLHVRRDKDAVRYSCRNIALLGLVIERVTGQSYPQFVMKTLIRPHRLHDVYPAMRFISPDNRARIVEGNYLEGKLGDPVNAHPAKTKLIDQRALNPARGCVSNAAGMAAFFHCLLSGKMLSSKHTEMLIKDTVVMGKTNPEMPRNVQLYSPGLTHVPFDTRDGDQRLIGHNGMSAGSISHVGWFQRLNLSICATTNFVALPPDRQHQFQGHASPHKLVWHLFRMINSVANEASQTTQFRMKIGQGAPLPALRTPSIPAGFNPEVAPK